MKKVSASIAAVVLTASCLVGCNPQTRILVAGDSWAWIMQLLRTFENPFAYDVAYMASPGDTAENWNLHRDWEARTLLEGDEDIDIVVLSLGGNDLMYRANIHQTEQEKASLIEEIGAHLEGVIDNILSVRSDMKIALLSYDYPNWDESMEWPVSWDFYHYDYERIGSPEFPIEVNSYLQRLGVEKWTIAEERDRVAFVNNFGLMQWKCGYEKYGIPPGSLPHPGYSPEGPIFGGDAEYYSPPKGMLSIPLLYCDAYHLSPAGYEQMTREAMERCVRDWLMLAERGSQEYW